MIARLRLERALAAIDAANADDPHTIDIGGQPRAKELAHAELMTAWAAASRAIGIRNGLQLT